MDSRKATHFTNELGTPGMSSIPPDELDEGEEPDDRDSDSDAGEEVERVEECHVLLPALFALTEVPVLPEE